MILPLVPSSSDVGPSVAVKSPTLRAVGLTVLVGRPPETREEETCILCQADSKDAAVQDKVFVQAVCVQRSCVLRQSSTECSPADVKELDTSEEKRCTQTVA